MANTKIPSELSSTPSISDSGDATAITITSGEGVGIGTTSPTTAKVVIAHAATTLGLHTTGGYNYQAKFESTDAEAAIVIEDSNSTDDGNRIGVITNDMTFITNNSEGMRITSAGKVGVNTTTVPHGSVGHAMFAMDGANNDTDGPHVQYTTASDNYPIFQQLNWGHDNISLNFDMYYDGSWRSSDAGSNYQIYKYVDELRFLADDGITAGGTVNQELIGKFDTSGRWTIPKQPHIFGTLTNTGGTGIANSWYDLAASSRSNLTVNTVSGQKRFTADVAGVYLVSITTIMDQTSVRKDTAIYHNGTKIGQTLNDEASGFHYRCWTHTIEMAANDYILVESDDWYDATTTNTVWRRLSMTLLS